jgi:hypothetical protein
MTVRKALLTIIGCALLFGAIGAAIGYAVGEFAPGYFRTKFRISRHEEEGFDPVGVGVGLGLCNGTVGGVVVGLIVVALVCWRETRLQKGAVAPSQGEGQSATSASASDRLLRATAWLLLLAFGISCGVFIGERNGDRRASYREYFRVRDALAPALDGDPAFAHVQLGMDKGGGVYMVGEVGTPADLERLRGVVTRVLGEPRSRELTKRIRTAR